MKKTYQKPEIAFENFALSKNIATCSKDVKMNLGNPENCSADLTDPTGYTITVFSSVTACGAISQYYNEDSYCYHAPNEDLVIFTS